MTSSAVSKMLGCSPSCARDIMSRLPCFRPSGRKRGSQMYVRVSDLEEFISMNTTAPGTPLPRTTEWVSKKEQESHDLKEWHKNRR